jgi:hypothetical protein
MSKSAEFPPAKYCSTQSVESVVALVALSKFDESGFYARKDGSGSEL